MLKIKTHSRRLSYQNLSSDQHNLLNLQTICSGQNLNDLLCPQVFLKNPSQPVHLPKRSKRHQHKTMTYDQINLDYCTTERKNSGQKVHFQNEMKKYNFDVKQLGQVLGQVSKQIVHELQKNKLLSSILSLMHMELQTKQPTVDSAIKKLSKKRTYQENIEIEKQKIQKVLNEKNKTISQQKKLIEQIENERKIRLIFENYFYLLEKQIHKHQMIYTTLLTRTASSKFLFLMTSTNDLVSNGHVLTLRKQDGKQNEKDLIKNSYMCLPRMDNEESIAENETENNKAKSSRLIGKKKAAKKLVKIMNFIATSKALEIEEMDLYEQQENYEKQNGVMHSCFKPMTMQRGTTFDQSLNSRTKKSIFAPSIKSVQSQKICCRNKHRTGQMISLKFIAQARQIYEGQFDQTVYELFKIYQALGINIFAKEEIGPVVTGERLSDDYFSFDQEQLVEQSERRLEYMIKSEGKMAKFNSLLEKKINLVEKNITQTERFVVQIERKIRKEKLKLYEEPDESSLNQTNLNQSIYHTLSNLLGINPNNYNSQQQIQSIIDQILQAEKQSQHINPTKKQSFDLSQNQQHSIDSINSYHRIQSRQSLPTFNSFVENKRSAYSKQKTKTQGHERKFTPLIVTGKVLNDNSNRKIAMGKTSRSIFENGMKSLNNLFDNMKACQSYQRVFERSQFEKEYSKEITKKKRVMFRRQAKVIPERLE